MWVLVAIWHTLTLFAGSNKTNVAYDILLHTLDVFSLKFNKKKTSYIVTIVIAFDYVIY